MSETNVRLTRPGNAPDESEVAKWLGKEAFAYWKQVTRMIERDYPDTFAPEWLFGGTKHGWSLRYKKGKSFCTLIPERHRCALLIVFGKEERGKVESIRDRLSVRTLEEYDGATTYHDGKWVLLTVDSGRLMEDVRLLFSTKRKPKKEKDA